MHWAQHSKQTVYSQNVYIVTGPATGGLLKICTVWPIIITLCTNRQEDLCKYDWLWKKEGIVEWWF
jgi:hypothetical protein